MQGVKIRWTLNRYEPSIFACQNASHEWTRRLSRASVKDDGTKENDEEDEEDEDDEEEEEEEEDEEDREDEEDGEDEDDEEAYEAGWLAGWLVGHK